MNRLLPTITLSRLSNTLALKGAVGALCFLSTAKKQITQLNTHTMNPNNYSTGTASLFARWMAAAVFAMGILAAGDASAQLTGTKSIPGDYATVSAAVTALNAAGVGSGGVTFNVAAGYTETLTAKIVLTASGTSANPIVFQKSGSGANPKLTSYAGTVTTAATTGDGFWVLSGSDYVTIDGIDLFESASNTTTTTVMEFGYGLFKASATDGAQYNTIKNCVLTLSRVNNGAGTGAWHNGTIGIAVMNATSTSSTALTITAATGSNSYNKFYTNTIVGGNCGIGFVGFVDPNAPYSFGDTGNDIGGTASGTGNSVLNYGGGASTNPATGIFLGSQNNLSCRYNTVNNNNGGGVNHATTLRGIFWQGGLVSSSGSVSNNSVTVTCGATTSQLSAIEVSPSAGNTYSITLDNNSINTAYPTATSGVTYGIYAVTATPQNLSISGNSFIHTTAATSGSLYPISSTCSVNNSGTVNIKNNTVSSVTLTATTTSAVVRLINVSGTMSTTTLSISGNTLNTISFTGTTGGTGAVTGIYSAATALYDTVSNNNINNWSIKSTGEINAIYNSYTAPANGSKTITNNYITTGLARNAAGTAVMRGYYDFGSSGSTVRQTMSGNNFSNLNNGSSTGVLVGISNRDGSGSSGKNVFNNTINNLNSSGGIIGAELGYFLGTSGGTYDGIYNNTLTNFTNGAGTGSIIGLSIANGAQYLNVYNNVINGYTNAGSGAVTGVQVGTGTNEVRVYNHKIYGLSGTNAASVVYGINVTSGTLTNVFNNYVGGLSATSSTSLNALIGIGLTGGTAANAYYNTIYLTGSGGGATFGNSGIFASTTPTVALNNNLVINASNAAGTDGYAVAYRRSSGTAGTVPASYAASSNNNIFYAGTPGASRLIYTEGTTTAAFTNSKQTLSDYKTFMATRDQGSQSENVATYFASTTGTDATYLHITAGSLTLAEGGGSAISGITTDFDGDSRNATTPDIGADEFSGSSPAPSITNVTITPTGNQCVAASRAVTADVTAPVGNITTVTLNYAFNGTVQTPVTMTNTSGSTWSGTIPAAAFPAADATVTWSVNANSDVPLFRSYSGTTYRDEPLTGIGVQALATPASVCTGSTTSLAASLYSNNAASYATPAAVANPTSDEDLGNVTITQGSTTILNNTTPIHSLVGTIGTATGTAGSYSNFTSFGPYGLTAGQAYSFSVSSLTSATAYGNMMAIYIDYNRDGDFADAGENVYVASTTTSGAHTETGTFTVPATAFNGLTRMLVLCNEGTITGPTMAISYGEREMYTLSITSTNYGGGGNLPTLTYAWSDGTSSVGSGAAVTATVSAATTYTVAATDANGCAISGTVAVTVIALPSAPTATNSTQCGLAVPTASVASTTGLTNPVFRWYSAATGGSPLQSSTSTTYQAAISATTTFYVAEFDGSCESNRTAITVTVNDPPAITVSAPVTICSGQSTTLSVSSTNDPSYKYEWSNSTVGASNTVSPLATNTYIVTATDTTAGTYAGCITTGSVTVTVVQTPSVVSVSPSSGILCEGASRTLVASGGQVAGTPKVFGTGTTTNTTSGYPAPYTNYYGGTKHQMLILASELTAQGIPTDAAITSITFTVNAVGASFSGSLSNFQIDLGHTLNTSQSNTSFVSGLTNVLPAQTVSIPVTGLPATVTHTFSTPFIWNGTSNLVIQTSYSNANSGSTATAVQMPYSATAFASCNFYRADGVTSATVLAATTPSANAVTNRPNMTLGWSLPIAWSWSPNTASTASVTVAPTATTTYTATSTINGCSNSGTATVTVNPLLTASCSSTNVTCNGAADGTAAVTAGGGNGTYSYAWSNGGTTASISGLAPGTYSVTVTDGVGCTATCSVTITQPTLLVATATPVSTTVCGLAATTSVTVTASGGTAPYTGEGTFTQGVGTTTYTVVDANGCTKTASVSVSTLTYGIAASSSGPGAVTPSGTTTVNCGSDQTYDIVPTSATCDTITDVLVDGVSVGAVSSYTFTNVTVAHTISASFGTRVYNITSSAGANGTISASAAVTCGTNKTFTITADACYQIADVLVDGVSVGAVGSYTFTNVTGDHTISASFTLIPYTITATAATGGSITPSGANTVLCGGSLSFTIAAGSGYVIDSVVVNGANLGAITSYSFSNVTANASINAYFSSCSNPATVTIPSAAAICSGNSYSLSGSFGGGATSATWSSSGTGTFDNTAVGTGSIYTPSAADIAAGSVVLTITTDDPDGTGACQVTTGSTVLTINATPTVNISGTAAFCTGGSTTLTANATNSNSYSWSSGQTTASVSVSAAGAYTVTVTGAGACTAAATVTVIENSLPTAPTVSASGSTTFCTGGSVTLTSSYTGGNSWSNLATTDAITVSAAGSYSVTYTDGNGCTAASSATTVVVNTSSASISGLLGICTGGSTTLTATATPAAVSYLWSDGSTNNTLSASAAGTYGVTTTDANGCTATASAVVVNAASFTVSVTSNCTSWVVGNTASLTATPSVAGTYTYLWSPGGNTSVTRNANNAGTYTATVTDAFGCTASGSVTIAGAALSGSFTVGSSGCGSFVKLADAITHINTYGLSGNTTLNVPAGYTETAPSGGFKLTACSQSAGVRSGPTRTLTIQKSGSGANPILTSATGTSTTADHLFAIVGADNVTIDGINLQEAAGNTTATTQMEFGYQVYKCDSNGTNDLVIRNCTVTLNKTNTASTGIRVVNLKDDNTTAPAAPTSGGAAADQAFRSKVSILSNTLTNVYNGIRLDASGSASSNVAGAYLNDTLNLVQGNTINSWAGSSVSAAGIYYANNRSITIRNNTLTGTTGQTSTLYGIQASSGVGAVISANTLTLIGSSTTYGIYSSISGGTGTAPNVFSLDSNTFQNWAPPSTGAQYIIYDIGSGGDSCRKSVQGNLITGFLGATTATGSIYGIYSYGTATGGTLTMSNNRIINNDFRYSTGTIYGIYGYLSSGNHILTGNLVQNNELQRAGGTNYLIYTGTSQTATIANNQVRNNRRTVLSTATTVGTSYAMYLLGGHAGGSNTYDNIVDSLYNSGVPGTATTIQYGIYLSNTTPNMSYYNNRVTNIFTSGASTGNQSMWGMYLAPSGTNSVMRNNIVSGIRSAAAQNGVIIGVQLAGSTTAGVTKFFGSNVICNLSSGGSTGNVRGIQISTGQDWYVYNNAISRITASASAPTAIGNQVLGVDISASTTGYNYYLYNNSIYLTGSGGGVNFATSGISVNSAVNVTLVNNLVINNITPGTSANSVAYRRSSTTLNTYQAASDNNLFYAGTPGATRLIYGETVAATPTNAKQTLADYKLYVTPRDANSRTETSTPFVNASTDSLLHIAATTATFVESGGKPYPATALTTDIDGQTRNALAPDIGADEGNFVGLLPQILSISASPATGQCVATSHVVTITTNSGVTGVTLNYSYSGVAQTPITMSGGSGTWTATIPAASPANATVTWSAVASDGTYTASASGTSYQDEYLSANTLFGVVSPTTVCAGSPVTLNAYLSSTAAAPTAYAASAATSTADEEILGVSLGTMSNTSGCGAIAPGAGSAAYLYSNYTTSITPPLLLAGQTYSGSVTQGYCGTGSYSNIVSVYIDYNRDGDFADAGENVWNSAYATRPLVGQVLPFSITIPSTVSLGLTRMRVVNNESSSAPATGTYTYGETEDYTVNLASGAGFSYSWSDGTSVFATANGSYSPPVAGSFTYTVTATDPNGCTVVASPVAVTVNVVPSTPTGTGSSQCGLAIPTCSVTGSGLPNRAFRWYLASSGGTPITGESGSTLTTYAISSTTTFYVSEYDQVTGCESGRVAVLVTVLVPDAVTASVSQSTVCPATTVTLNVTQATPVTNNYQYEWFRGTTSLTIGATATDAPVLPGTNTYTVVATDAGLGCATSSTVTVTVTAPPSISSVYASSASVCAGSPTTLSAVTSGLVPGTRTLGNGSFTSTLYAPYYTYYGANKRQYILTAAELAASGLSAGNLTGVSFDYSGYVGPYDSIVGMSINMKSSLLTNFATANFEAGLVNVLPTQPTYRFTTGSGTVAYTFATPFYWNGTSNVIIEFCYGNNDPGLSTGSSPSVYYVSTSPDYRCIYQYLDNVTASSSCANPSGYRTTIRPVINFTGAVPGLSSGSYTWSWSDGSSVLGTGNSITVNPLVPTTYIVTATDLLTGCTNTSTVFVDARAIPVAPVATNSIQCGTSVPTASVASASGAAVPVFNWYDAATSGNLVQGPGAANGALEVYYQNSFSGGSAGGTLYGNAQWSNFNQRVELTPNMSNKAGAFEVPASGRNADKYRVQFKMTTNPNGGADGMSYSFGSDVDAASTSPTAEFGTGSYLRLGFDAYGGTGATGTAGIRLLYGTPIGSPDTVVAAPGVIGWVRDTSWIGTTKDVDLTIDSLGRVTVKVGATTIFNNVSLPASYLTADKSTWKHMWKGRTGSISMLHAIDDVTVSQSGYEAGKTTYNSLISATTTFYVDETSNGCTSARTPVTVTVVTPDGIQVTSTGNTCFGGTVDLSVADTASVQNNAYSYVWTAADANAGLPGSIPGSGLIVTPSAAGTYTYTVTAIDSASPYGVCQSVAYQTVTVYPIPTIDSVNYLPAGNVCALSPISLNAYVIGSGPQTPPSYTVQGNPSFSSTADEEIFNVTLGTLNNTSNCASLAAGPGSVNSSYNNYTTSVAAPTLVAASTYNASVTVGYCASSTYSNMFTMYIDWNRDGDFLDAGESVYTKPYGASALGGTAWPFTVTVPATASAGVTRMRVVLNESSTAPTPAQTGSWGEGEDYLINVLALSNGGLTWNWEPGSLSGNSVSVSPSAATTYTVTATNSGGCSTSSTVTVPVLALPATPTAINNTICGLSLANVGVTSNSGLASPVFRWYLDPVGGSPIASQSGTSLSGYYLSTADTFYVSEYDGSCESQRVMVIQSATQPDAVTASSSVSTICLGQSSVDLSAAQTGSTNVYTYSWSATPPVGSGLSGVQLGPLTTLFANDFTSSVLPSNVTVYGNASITGGVLQVNPNLTSQNGGVKITAGGNAADTISVEFDLIVPQNGADGVSYSYSNDGDPAVQATMNAENGTGSKLKLGFVSYTNGTSTNGIYLMYNCTTNEQTPTTSGVLSYSSNVSWRGSATPVRVAYTVGQTGLFNLSLNGTPVFTNIQLPAAYLTANKSNWYHVFKGRTGAVSEEHSIDNMVVKVAQIQSTPTPGQNVTVTPTVAGTYAYYVTATDGQCTTSSSVNVQVRDIPIKPTLGNDLSVCDGSTLTLTALGGGISTGVVTYTNPSFSSTLDEEIFNVTLGTLNNTSTCTSVAAGAGSVLSSYNNYTTSVAAPALNLGQTYNASVTVGYCGSSTYSNVFSMWIDYNQDGDFLDAGETVYTNAYTASALGGTAWPFTVTVPTTAIPGTTRMRVVVYESSAVTPTQTGSWGEGEDYSVTIVPPGTVTWSSIPSGFTATGLSTTVGPVTGSAVSYIATINDGYCSNADTVVITPLTTPAKPVLTVSKDTICGSGTATYTSSVITLNATLQWQYYDAATSNWVDILGATGTSLTTPTITPIIGDSILYYRLVAGCGTNVSYSDADTLQIVKPYISSLVNDTVCGTGQVSLIALGNGTFEWFGTSTSAPVLKTGGQFDTTIVSNQVYWVRARVGTCIDPMGRQPVYGVVNQAPDIFYSSARTICEGSSTTLTVTSPSDTAGYYTYTWSPGGQTGGSIVVSPSATTSYTVVASNASSGCNNFGTVAVTVNPRPIFSGINATADSICQGQSVTLSTSSVFQSPGPVTIGAGTTSNTTSGQNPFSTNWEGAKVQMLYTAAELQAAGLVAGNITAISYNLSTVGTRNLDNYALSIGTTSATTMSGFLSGLTQVYTTPSLTVTSTGVQTFTFTAPFYWNGTSSIVVQACHNNDPTGSCASCYGGVAGALSTTTTGTTVWGQYSDNTAPTNPWDMCSGTGTTLTGTGGTSRANATFLGITGTPVAYSWNPGSATTSTITVSPVSTTTYTATVTNTVSGCSYSQQRTVFVKPFTAPSVTASGSTTICQGGSVTLDAGAGYDNYSWSDGSTTQSVDATTSGTYTVTVTNNNGCSGTASSSVTVNPVPTPSVNSSLSSICEGADVATLSVTGSFSSYLWSNGATTATTTATLGGTYSVAVTNSFGCSGSGSYTLAGSPAPLPPSIIIPSTDTLYYCWDGVTAGSVFVMADVQNEPTTLWNDPLSTSGDFALLGIGTGPTDYGFGSHLVTITSIGAGGCTAVDSIRLIVTQNPAPTITGDLTLCSNVSGATTTLDAGAGYSIYSWSDGSTTRTITATAGTYSVTVTGTGGCTGSATAVVSTVDPVEVTTSETACDSYSWSVDGNTYTLSGTYSSVVGTAANGCDSIAVLELTVNASSAYTDVQVACNSFTWIDGVDYTLSGTYGPLYLTNDAGCDSIVTLDLTINTNCGGGVTLNLTAYLEGYYLGSNTMQATLANQGEPNATGAETDTIYVELRDSLDPTIVVDVQPMLIMTDGTGSAVFPQAVPGTSYWICIRHRMSVQTWSSAEVLMAATTSYDFSTSDTQAFGNNMKEVEPGVWAIFSGDLNQDEFVDPFDYGLYEFDSINFAYGYYATDMNGDGFVDPFDYGIYEANSLNFVMSSHP